MDLKVIQIQACGEGHKLITNYKYNKLEKLLTDNGLTVEISNNAGNYLCNHIFYTGMKFIRENKINAQMIFIHVPSIKNIENIDCLAKIFSIFIDTLI